MLRPATTSMRLRRTGDGVSVAFGDEPREAARMRETVRSVLPDWMPPTEVEDTIVVVSELVTNALVHGRSPRMLQVQLRPQGLLLDVSDGSPTPAATVDQAGRIGGRGLQIVGLLSSEWGSEPDRGNEGGKHVWCLLPTAAQRHGTA